MSAFPTIMSTSKISWFTQMVEGTLRHKENVCICPCQMSYNISYFCAQECTKVVVTVRSLVFFLERADFIFMTGTVSWLEYTR